MPRYTENYNECTNPAAADWIEITDMSETADRERKVSAGLIPWTNAAAAFSDKITTPRIGSVNLGLIADDAAISFTPKSSNGVIILIGSNLATVSGMIMYRCGGGSQCAILAATSNTLLATTTDTVLTGTTGADGKVTISANAGDGKIYIENRRGAGNTTYYYLEIGT